MNYAWSRDETEVTTVDGATRMQIERVIRKCGWIILLQHSAAPVRLDSLSINWHLSSVKLRMQVKCK